MKNMWQAEAGSIEKGDVLVRITRNDVETIDVCIEAKPVILKQYGDQMHEAVLKTVKKARVTGIRVVVQDNQALDYVIIARIKAALHKYIEQEGQL